ncbi:YrhK family protein [Gilvimarinus xylanilyticus]|uniref:YrhK family protein n=1 Tax=Gilvimarinus xylanilyticus TaxID=2944139 RepID=A0A9X2I5C4_9GAMM|nr:YrhK family protein [Gilvimarinus xylanilyticus]MCP8900650.1 YrhK family protein [Gilvimarinus xylanilyticus]
MTNQHRFMDNRLSQKTERHRQITARYDLWYSLNDLGAGLMFVIGSILFFSEATQTPATWLFLTGSILFTVRPTIRVVQDIHLRRLSHNN